MKKIILAILLCANLAHAGDLVRAVTFQNLQTLSASDLHNLIDTATINTTWFSSRPNDPTLLPSDTLLVFSPTLSGYYQISANSLVFNNPFTITNLPETTAGTNDWFAIYNGSASAMRKVNPYDFLTPTLIYSFFADTNSPTSGDWVLTYDGGTLSSNLLSGGTLKTYSNFNLWEKGLSISSPTNLSVDTKITNSDTILTWTTPDGTNYTPKTSNLQGLFTNATASTLTNNSVFTNSAANSTTGTNFMLFALQLNYQTNGVPTNSAIVSITGTQLQSWLSQLSGHLTFRGTNSIPLTAQFTNTYAHGLGATPDFVSVTLYCITNDASSGGTFITNQEVAITSVFQSKNVSSVNYQANPACTVFYDSANVYVVGQSGNWQVGDVNAGNINRNNFKLKVVAEKFSP